MEISVLMIIVGVLIIWVLGTRQKNTTAAAVWGAIGSMIATVGLATIRPQFSPALRVFFDRETGIVKVWANTAFSSINAVSITVGIMIAIIAGVAAFTAGRNRGNGTLMLLGFVILLVVISTIFPRFLPATGTALGGTVTALGTFLQSGLL